jgi:hypothetical protein
MVPAMTAWGRGLLVIDRSGPQTAWLRLSVGCWWTLFEEVLESGIRQHAIILTKKASTHLAAVGNQALWLKKLEIEDQ